MFVDGKCIWERERQNQRIEVLKVSNVEIVNDENLPDSMHVAWDHQIVAAYVEEFVNKYNINEIITFDDQGVSGHINHIATFYGVKRFYSSLRNTQHLKIRTLRSVQNPWLKFCGPVLIVLYILNTKLVKSLRIKSSSDIVCVNCNFLNVMKAMFMHFSQLEWYRILFVIFSCYTYMNIFSTVPQA
eukprot:TRINITY_DN15666_c0_g2_i4.p3 TRINITY_DN15666_c0_g2~~TRINITY_DN15666_c0_g2_i4.p3  ORF type:complete len:186 (+),score=9.24 TRINITY_DN15666_c0_g2_i4:267-824(+)